MVQVIRRGPAPTSQPGAPVPAPVAPRGPVPAPVRPVVAVKPQGAPRPPPAPAPLPAPGEAPPSESAPSPGPVISTGTVSVTRPTSFAPRPSGPRAPRAGPGGARPGGRPPFRSGPPRPPPTADEIAVLARKERVPNRIAKGELEGKMKCRIWKKLHAEEARRFEQAWVLVDKTPGLDISDAFGVVQSGMPVDDFLKRRARVKKKEEVKQARSAVEPQGIDGFIAELVKTSTELSFVLGERTFLDVIRGVQPVAFDLERSGPTPKLNVVLMTRRTTWERLAPTLERDPRLSQKPATVSRQPAKRPVSDPRPFAEHVGQTIKVQLRNGIALTAPLLAVGPFDVLLGEVGEEFFVPLHAMLSWSPA